ncbi:hypothetical protein AXX16_2697 [Serratia rubidaea]|nr:hypothetical protein AXX16_2697 [Serratia rubidaea]
MYRRRLLIIGVLSADFRYPGKNLHNITNVRSGHVTHPTQ